MNTAKHILVPTDVGACADEALDYAVALAENLGATITVMHAYEIPVAGFSDAAFVSSSDVAQRVLDAGQGALDAAVAQRKGRGVPLKALLKNGEPREKIVAVAEIGADLIVMGTHGRRGLARALLGSVAESVVRHSACPVLTVSPSQTARRADEDEPRSAPPG